MLIFKQTKAIMNEFVQRNSLRQHGLLFCRCLWFAWDRFVCIANFWATQILYAGIVYDQNFRFEHYEHYLYLPSWRRHVAGLEWTVLQTRLVIPLGPPYLCRVYCSSYYTNQYYIVMYFSCKMIYEVIKP